MIALDSSSLIAYLEGAGGQDVTAVESALEHKQAVLPPVVLCEMLSDPVLPKQVAGFLEGLPVLAVSDGFWVRAGLLRAKLLSKGLRARLADSLIAQACIDHDVPLVARDRDFRHFEALGLNLLVT